MEKTSFKGGKRKRKYFQGNNKKVKRYMRLESGMKGFIVTCNNKEKQCIAEAYNLLNEFGDILYGPEQKEGMDGDDIEKQLADELSELKNKPERRFQVVDTGINNCLFIKTTIPDPAELASSVFLGIEKSQEQRARFLMRLLPVLQTCHADWETVQRQCAKFVDDNENLLSEASTFAVVFHARCNEKVGRVELIPFLAGLIHSKCPDIKADLKNPEVVISVDVIARICCFSIVKNYYKFKKYNPIEFLSLNKRDRVEVKQTGEVLEKVDELKEVKENAKVESSGDQLEKSEVSTEESPVEKNSQEKSNTENTSVKEEIIKDEDNIV